eukprot:gb/GEZN01010839.1/.p1 GENE.gb/GEZN01010839.1/~~gb/GEZN01010839.1/.p1  ORF type:complete len:167 (+),score=9.08 gb/GEZN01010839.1/:240-740(+)
MIAFTFAIVALLTKSAQAFRSGAPTCSTNLSTMPSMSWIRRNHDNGGWAISAFREDGSEATTYSPGEALMIAIHNVDATKKIRGFTFSSSTMGSLETGTTSQHGMVSPCKGDSSFLTHTRLINELTLETRWIAPVDASGWPALFTAIIHDGAFSVATPLKIPAAFA